MAQRSEATPRFFRRAAPGEAELLTLVAEAQVHSFVSHDVSNYPDFFGDFG
jgi:hypothetical protein